VNRDFRTRHPATRGKALVLRFAGVQMLAASVIALGVGLMSGWPASQAALAGGAVVAMGNVIFGWRLFAPGIAPAARIARAMWLGEGLKWLWVVVAVWLALMVAELAPLPFFLGLVAAQVGFWVGIAFLR
jgi:F0F1-type ATP synthase assembly protein I